MCFLTLSLLDLRLASCPPQLARPLRLIGGRSEPVKASPR
jgi:hypothetical protein